MAETINCEAALKSQTLILKGAAKKEFNISKFTDTQDKLNAFNKLFRNFDFLGKKPYHYIDAKNIQLDQVEVDCLDNFLTKFAGNINDKEWEKKTSCEQAAYLADLDKRSLQFIPVWIVNANSLNNGENIRCLNEYFTSLEYLFNEGKLSVEEYKQLTTGFKKHDNEFIRSNFNQRTKEVERKIIKFNNSDKPVSVGFKSKNTLELVYIDGEISEMIYKSRSSFVGGKNTANEYHVTSYHYKREKTKGGYNETLTSSIFEKRNKKFKRLKDKFSTKDADKGDIDGFIKELQAVLQDPKKRLQINPYDRKNIADLIPKIEKMPLKTTEYTEYEERPVTPDIIKSMTN